MKLARREFVQGMGALGAAAGISLDAVAQAVKAAKPAAKGRTTARPPLDVKHVKSGCAICPNFCGIDATVVNGVIRIRPCPTRITPSRHHIARPRIFRFTSSHTSGCSATSRATPSTT